MQIQTYRKRLDMQKSGIQWSVNAKIGDAGSRRIVFTVTDGGNPFYISDDLDVTVYAVKPDETVLYNACTVSDGKAVYDITNQTLAAEGTVECELRIEDNGQIITSPKFNIEVESVIDNDNAIVSSNEFTALIEATQEAIEATENANTATEEATEAAESANTAATTATEAAENANTAATTANGAAENANTAATTANEAAENANTAATTATEAAENANTATTAANEAAENANTATTAANEAAESANTAAENAKIEVTDLTNTVTELKETVTAVETNIEKLDSNKLNISDIDSTLSDSSENPVQNKAIYKALQNYSTTDIPEASEYDDGSMLIVTAGVWDIFNIIEFENVQEAFIAIKTIEESGELSDSELLTVDETSTATENDLIAIIDIIEAANVLTEDELISA